MVAYRDGVARPIPFQVDERVPGKGDRDGGRSGAAARRPPRRPRPRRSAGLHGLRRRRARARTARRRPRSGTRDPDRRSARPHRSAGPTSSSPTIRRSPTRRYVEYDAAHDRVRGGALSRRHGRARCPTEFAVGLVGTDGAEPDGRAAAARRGDAARGTGALGDHRARRQARAGRLDRGSGARRAPLAAQGRHRDGHPAHRRPGAHLLLRRARLRAGRDEAAVLAVRVLPRHHRDGRRRSAAVSRAGTTSRRASRRPASPIDGHMDQREQSFTGQRDLVRARRPTIRRSWSR